MVFGVRMLKGAAEDWWDWDNDVMIANNALMDWTHFKIVFLNNYVPIVHRVNIKHEFLQLKQDNILVADFFAKFTKLSHFSPHTRCVTDEQWKIEV